MLLLSARPREFQGVIERLPCSPRQSEPDTLHFSLPKTDLRVTATGTNPEDIAEKIARLPKQWFTGRPVIFTGTAGALNHELDLNSLIGASRLVTDVKTHDPPSPAQIIENYNLPLEPQDFTTGPLLTSGHPVLEKKKRLEKARQTGAIAVDMEAAHVYHYLAAKNPGVDFLCLKIISDTPSHTSLDTVFQLQEPAIEQLGKKIAGTVVKR